MPASAPERTTARVADAVHGDADRVSGLWVLADRAQAKADGRTEEHEVARDDQHESATQIRMFHVSERLVDERVFGDPEPGERDGGNGGNVTRRPLVGVDLDEEVPVTPSARKFTAKPLTIWSARRWMAMKAWTSASAAPGTTPVTMPHHQSPGLSAPRKPKNAPVRIIPRDRCL